jgi:hypothetical protein
MAPYARWVLDSFRQILLDACDEYLDTNDRGSEKKRSKLITRVSKDISDIVGAKKERIPDDLEKVVTACSFVFIDSNCFFQSVRIWFGNYAAGHAKERDQQNQVDTRGHPTSSKTWTAKSVCAHLFSGRISDEQKRLSDDGEKDIGKYRAALSTVFEGLNEEE